MMMMMMMRPSASSSSSREREREKRGKSLVSRRGLSSPHANGVFGGNETRGIIAFFSSSFTSSSSSWY